MEESVIINNRDTIYSFVKDGRIVEALDRLADITGTPLLKKEHDEALKLKETYRYMLHYLIEGVRDDGREDMLSDLKGRIMTVADHYVRKSKGESGSDYFSSRLRYNNLRGESISSQLISYSKYLNEYSLAEAAGNDLHELRKNLEDLRLDIFGNILTSVESKEDYAMLLERAESELIDEPLMALSISAMILSSLLYYDKHKLKWLIDIFENSEDPRISAKTLVGIVLILERHGEIAKSDRKLMARLSLWNDDIDTYRKLRETIRVIVGTRDTERVVAKMKDEVIPGLMKLRPDMLRKMKDLSADPDPTGSGFNPEWEELLENSGLSDKMRELSELQNDGADVMMLTFSNLKQFTFFNNAANWFLPFDTDNTELNLPEEMKDILKLMNENNTMVCDSDMYSLALASSKMPEAQRTFMTSQFSAQLDQFKEEAKELKEKSSTPEFDIQVLKTVRDFYRFFKLFRSKESFADPFTSPLRFTELPVIGEMMDDPEVVRLIGEFYFKRGYYDEALPLLLKLSEEPEDASDYSLWQKIGFCYQTKNQFKEALEAYTKSSLLKAPGTWLLKKLAYINKMLGNFDDAAEYYRQVLEKDPENLQLILSLGNIYIASGDRTSALREFYHADYLSPDNVKIRRKIAWSELINGNFAKSLDIYEKILSRESDMEDYLNAGHAAFLAGDLKKASQYYKRSCTLGKDDFRESFLFDIETLERLGADRNTALMILDSTMLKED